MTPVGSPSDTFGQMSSSLREEAEADIRARDKNKKRRIMIRIESCILYVARVCRVVKPPTDLQRPRETALFICMPRCAQHIYIGRIFPRPYFRDVFQIEIAPTSFGLLCQKKQICLLLLLALKILFASITYFC